MNDCMKLNQLTASEVNSLLHKQGLQVVIGPYTVNIQSQFSIVSQCIYQLYALNEINTAPFADFHIRISSPSILRKWLRAQAQFSFDGFQPFKPLPSQQAYAMFEWGLNWCIASNSHQYLIIHAAVVERHEKAIILPGMPGAGKSTLCASLVENGWRLLSDEMALICTKNGAITPIPRPIALKNQSIDIIRQYHPEATIGPSIKDTAKGTIAHVRPSIDSISHCNKKALAHHIVFPNYQKKAPSVFETIAKTRAFYKLAENSFNFHILGLDGAKTLNNLIRTCSIHQLTYSNLAEANTLLSNLSQKHNE